MLPRKRGVLSVPLGDTWLIRENQYVALPNFLQRRRQNSNGWRRGKIFGVKVAIFEFLETVPSPCFGVVGGRSDITEVPKVAEPWPFWSGTRMLLNSCAVSVWGPVLWGEWGKRNRPNALDSFYWNKNNPILYESLIHHIHIYNIYVCIHIYAHIYKSLYQYMCVYTLVYISASL